MPMCIKETDIIMKFDISLLDYSASTGSQTTTDSGITSVYRLT